MSRPSRAPKSPLRWLGAATVIGLTAATFSAVVGSPAQAVDWSACLDGSSDTQAAFERAADVSGVPEDVLLAVGYLGSQWNQHDGAPSTSGGYGVMHLTDFAVDHSVDPAKGDSGRGPDRAGTLRLASDLTGFTAEQVRTDPAANICGGAAVLASYQPDTASQASDDWTKAIADYAGTADKAEMVQFTGQVFDVLRSGATETTDLGDTVTLAADPDAQLDRAGLEAAGALEPGVDEIECPATVECEVIEALYVQTDPANPKAYVNYDLADRENDVSIDYLVVHDTECDYDDCVGLIQEMQDPASCPGTTPSGRPTDTSRSTSPPTTWRPTPATGTSTCTRSASSTRGTPQGRAPGTPSRSTARPPR